MSKKQVAIAMLTKLDRNDVIGPCCFHSMDDGITFRPVMNSDSVGQPVSEFSQQRTFWKVDEVITMEDEVKEKYIS